MMQALARPQVLLSDRERAAYVRGVADKHNAPLGVLLSSLEIIVKDGKPVKRLEGTDENGVPWARAFEVLRRNV
jgi:hypothetical protein